MDEGAQGLGGAGRAARLATGKGYMISASGVWSCWSRWVWCGSTACRPVCRALESPFLFLGLCRLLSWSFGDDARFPSCSRGGLGDLGPQLRVTAAGHSSVGSAAYGNTMAESPWTHSREKGEWAESVTPIESVYQNRTTRLFSPG